MFSHDERCIYRHNPIADVICQLRFPEILTIGANLPVEFQEAIRAEFPRFGSVQETPAPKLTGTPGNFTVQNQPASVNYHFSSADGVWRVNLTSKFISLTCSRYDCWEEFAKKLDKPLAAFIKLYQPAYFERVGLRYLNFISRKDLELEDRPFRELIAPCWLGPLALDGANEAGFSRNSVDAEFSLRGGCRAKVHAGPGNVKRSGKADPELKFVLDMDLYMSGNVPVNLSAGALQTLHSQAYPLFRGAITDTLHDAMETI